MEKSFKSVKKDLRISHFAQIPCEAFEFVIKYNSLDNIPIEVKAAEIVNILAKQHLFLGDNEIIPDFCNAIIVSVQNDEGEWEDYYNEEEEADWDEMENLYLNEIVNNHIDFDIE